MLVSAGSHYGVGPRPRMEDKHALHRSWLHSEAIGEWNLFIVADGHGGSRAAEFSVRQLPACLRRKLEENDWDFRTALKLAFEETDKNFLEMARKMSMSDGTTLIAALIGPDRVYVAHVGDCGAVLVSDRSEEEVCDLNTDSFSQASGVDAPGEGLTGLEDITSSDGSGGDGYSASAREDLSVPIPERLSHLRGPFSPCESRYSESPSTAITCPNPVSSASSSCSGDDGRSLRTARRTIRGINLVSAHRADVESEQALVRSRGGIVFEDPDGALRVNGLLQVTRALGDLSFKPWVSCEPEICEFDVPPGMVGTLVLASDGVCDFLTPEDIAAMVREDCVACKGGSGDECEHAFPAARDPTAVAKRIIAAAYERDSQDNATAVVIHFSRPRPTVEEH